MALLETASSALSGILATTEDGFVSFSAVVVVDYGVMVSFFAELAALATKIVF